ncbi:hypothetical protein GGR57DRAFT_300129 [Xylariaceae sp. FL1272]|nr:hypothetical protein GGR57DRAFT_300129 [Xylariaceae sp. FL1272]
MAGVPGRSKGCNTCRQRRVECGEERPICTRCTQGGFVCRGYARDAQWLHLTTGSGSSSQLALGRLVEVEKTKPVGVRSAKGETQMTLLPLSKSVSLAAFQDDICFGYIFSNFVWRGYGSSWFKQSAEGVLGQPAFDSVKALAQTNFGKSQKSQGVEIQGRMKYGKSLRSMFERLEAGQMDEGRLSDLVIPILLLLMHSTTLSNQAAAIFHLQALKQIFKICGPEPFQHQPLRDAYEAARATMVVASLVLQKRTFLDDPSWHTGVYALMPMSKPTQSYLLDILAAVPGFLEEYNTLEVVISKDPGHCDFAAAKADILDRVMTKLELLFIWRLHWQHAFGSQVWLEPSSQQGSAQLLFSRPGLAADLALYNAVLVWLLALVHEFEPLRAEAIVEACAVQAQASMLDVNFSFTSPRAAILRVAVSFEPLSAIGTFSRPRDTAEEICRIFEWQSYNHASASWETNPVYLFPISLAMCLFDTDPSSRHWIRTMLNAHELTRDYGVDYGETNESGSRTSDTDNGLDGESMVVTAGGLEVEIGVLHRLQGFGWYVTRELAGNVAEQGDQSHHKIPSPNLVHLLLIRGRADIRI